MLSLLLTTLLLADPRVTDVTTEHYHIRSAGPDAEVVGRMLEGLHGQLANFFGRRPEGRLEVEIHATREAYQEAIARAGLTFVGGGGYYALETKKVYLFPQPSEYFTRQLILHEAAHQFHFLVATGNTAPRSAWYAEGLAEYFAVHNFDDRVLQLGVVPAITLEDYPAKATNALDALDWDLKGIISGRVKAGRPLAWSLVHFLVHRRPAEFKRLAARLDRDEEPLSAWQATLGRITPEFVSEYRKWVEQHSQPWSIVWTAWQEVGNRIEGHSRVVGVSVLKETSGRLEAEMELVDGRLKAGLVFGYRSPQDFYMLQVFSHGWVRIVRRVDDQWETLVSEAIPRAKHRNVVALSRDKSRVTLSVNRQEVRTLEAPGQVGLNVDGCRVRFRVEVVDD
jgi:uncharacterized protein DUF1570